jgi:hypothetical protein
MGDFGHGGRFMDTDSVEDSERDPERDPDRDLESIPKRERTWKGKQTEERYIKN